MYSRNARNVPGINAWSDWIYFEKGHWVGVKGNIAHYQYVDNRYVKGAYLHNKSVSLKVALGKRFDLSACFEHWAQWGGASPVYGYQPATFNDFMLVFMAGRGGEGATQSDKINVLGNHLGKEAIRLDWKHDLFTMSFQYDKPFEDSSGMKFQNAPDGVWSVQFRFNDRNAVVTDLVMEYVNTTWQSGAAHDRPATEEEKAEESCRKNRQSYWNSTEHYIQGYLAGLHEGQPKWHDLRKDPNELPKDDKQYLVLYYYNYKGKKEMSYGVRDNLHSDFEIHRNYTEQIIAWCEIPQFKE